MDRIEERLSEFTDLHTMVVSRGYGMEDGEWQRASDKGQQIIEDFRAMVEALEGMLADERRLLRWVRTAVDDSMTYCAFCDASHPDEAKIEHRDGCAVLLAETTLARVRGGE